MSLTSQANAKLAAKLVLAWLFLNLVLNVDYPELSTPFQGLLRPSLDIWALLLILSLLAVLGVAQSAWVHVLLILAVVFIRLFRFGDALIPLYFCRPFNLYIDSASLPALIDLLYHSFSWQLVALYGLATVAILMAFLWGIHKSFQVASKAFLIQRVRRVFWVLTGFLTVLVCFSLSGAQPFDAGFRATTCAPRLMEEVAFIVKIGEIRRQGLSAVQMAGSRIPTLTKPLADLGNRDVYLFFIESYGETLFANTRHAEEFAPLAQAFEAALTQAGFSICSRFLESPTFGGSSWLAFGTLESGVWLPDQLRYNFLLSSKVSPIAAYFSQAGYRTVSVMPGTTMPWPEGGYFQYAQTFYAKDLDYQGPSFGWSPMPDQYAISAVYTREIDRRNRPLFIRYILTSTHAPFNCQPPYLQNWNEVGTGEIYNRLQTVTFDVNWPDMRTADKAYLASIGYDFTVLRDYLIQFVKDEALIIILGDHQPIRQISGPGATGLVPVHAICRKRALLDPFLRMGYTPGMVPTHAPPNNKSMQDFLSDFLIGFSRTEANVHPEKFNGS